MNGEKLALLGVLGPLLAFLFIGVSIFFSPWFRWDSNALSDLGHCVKSDVAVTYNFGLILSGFLLQVYGFTVMGRHARFTGYCVVVSAFFLQLVGAFDEIYGFTHYLFSILLFVSMGFSTLAYGLEKRCLLAFICFAVSLFSWIIYWSGFFRIGVAVPELISALSVLPWLFYSAVKIYRSG